MARFGNARFGQKASLSSSPPVLSLPTGTKTGSSTATGTVSTDIGNGTLYFLASINATETSSAIKVGSSQVVGSSGTKNVSFTGLTPNTAYYAHYLQTDNSSNDSNIVSSSSFTTDATSSFIPAWAKKTNTLIGAM